MIILVHYKTGNNSVSFISENCTLTLKHAISQIKTEQEFVTMWSNVSGVYLN